MHRDLIDRKENTRLLLLTTVKLRHGKEKPGQSRSAEGVHLGFGKKGTAMRTQKGRGDGWYLKLIDFKQSLGRKKQSELEG